MNAIVLLTLRPDPAQLAFFRTLKKAGYDLFVAVDDNGYLATSSSSVRYIQYDNEECVALGFTNANFAIKATGPTAWDKALRFFCEHTEYSHVWFVEEDVFVPTATTLSALDAKYGSADLLAESNKVNRVGDMDWFWPRIQRDSDLPLPWAAGMVCAVRLSRALLAEIDAYRLRYKKLFFIEGLFHTLALQKSLAVVCAPELQIFYKRSWRQSEIKRDSVYHPVKDMKRQVELRAGLK